jgi:DNA helicase HerA-like ATPase
MAEKDAVFLGASSKPEELLLRFGNRHGLITGATGTGKTVTLQIMAEGFSAAGVPVFAADVKGDLSGISQPGTPKDALLERAKQVGLEDYGFQGFPTIFWDLFGEQGHPVRTTISEMGPVLLSRLMSLTEAQEGALNIAFRIADEEGLALLDMKDLRAMLADIASRAGELRTEYGNISSATIGAIQRRLLVLEEQGADKYFGEPALSISDLMRTTPDGRGYVNILAADKLMQAPTLYATFLLALMSELFEELPEVGNPDKPKLVFIFDEAHLLFDNAPPALIQKVEQVVRLIRSKGVGIYFVTQNPLDIPETVLAQLGNRIQHALRAYTPREQKAVKAAATTFRQNPDLDTETAITQLATGQALVSVLEGAGVPSVVQQTWIRPPSSRIGPITPEERRLLIAASPVYGLYDTPLDRESAYEILNARAQKKADEAAAAAAELAATKEKQAAERASGRQSKASSADSLLEGVAGRIVRNVASQVGSQIGRALVRGILGSLTKGR